MVYLKLWKAPLKTQKTQLTVCTVAPVATRKMSFVCKVVPSAPLICDNEGSLKLRGHPCMVRWMVLWCQHYLQRTRSHVNILCSLLWEIPCEAATQK